MILIGLAVYFKRESDTRKRKGVVLSQDGDGYHVQGARTATRFNPPVYTLMAHEIITGHIPTRDRIKKTERHGTGLSITAAESLRRQEIGTARLGLSESEVLQARAMLEIRKRTLCKLAASNGITPTREDFDFEEISGEYLVASLASLRSATSKATDADIKEFRHHLHGQVAESRIMMTIAKTAKTAAVRYLRKRSFYHAMHVDISDYERRLYA